MAPKLVKVKLLEEGSHLGRKGDIVAVPETMLPHLLQLRQQHDGTKLVPFRMACLADEAEALEQGEAKQVTEEDVANMTQAEAEAAGLKVGGGSDPAAVGNVSKVAAEKRAAEAAAKAEAEERKEDDEAEEAEHEEAEAEAEATEESAPKAKSRKRK